MRLGPWSSTSPPDHLGLPILPGALPVIGHSYRLYLGGDGLGVFRRGREQLGPLFWLNMGLGLWTLMCTGPEAFEVLRLPNMTTVHLGETIPVILDGALLAQEGAFHRHLRSAMNGPFTPRGLVASGVSALTAEVLAGGIERWVTSHRPIAVLPELQVLTLDAMFRIMGVEPGQLATWRRQFSILVRALYLPALKIWGSPTHQASRARGWLDRQLHALISAARRSLEAEAGPLGGGVVAALTRAHDDEDRPLLDEELVNNLRFLALAGHETTAAALSWMALVLASRSDLWETLCAEVAEVQRGGGDIPRTTAEIRRYSWTEALFREVLRYYSPIFITNRRTTDWITLHGQAIPPQTIVTVSPTDLSRDPTLFVAPDRFDPSRWLERRTPPTQLETVPFGGGPHFCLGYHLAWTEAVQFAVALAQGAMRAGVRPRLAGGTFLRQVYGPVSHPPARSRIEFVRAG